MLISPKDVKIKVEAEPEDVSLAHAGREYGPEFVKAVRANIAKSRTWGWCCAKVTVSLKRGPKWIEGDCYLGCCSYTSKKDFIDNSGYYDQMVNDAIIDLTANLKSRTDDISRSIEEFFGLIDGDLVGVAKDFLDIEFKVAPVEVSNV